MTKMDSIRWTQVQPGDVIVSGPHGGGSDPFFTIDRPLPPLTAQEAIEALRNLEPVLVDQWDADAYEADEVQAILDRVTR